MESQLHRPYDHTDDQDPQHAAVEDEGDHHHHEKTSVMRKVKAKAKKIKETLAKHGLGHEHEHERDYSHDDPDEGEENEDEEMEEDPEVHGAPMYESTVIGSAIPAQNVNLEKPTAIGETGATRLVFEGQSGENLGKPSAMEVVHAPEDKDISFPPEIRRTKGDSGARNDNENVGPQGFRIGALEGLEEDPQAPKNRPGEVLPSNYQTKVTDPTGKGGEEVGITPLIQSFNKMGVYDESVPKSESGQEGYTGSHGQFAPEPNPTEGKSDSAPKSCDPSKPEDNLPRDTLTGKSSDQSGYVEKISLATSTIADKAMSAKNVVASKLGYGGTEGGKVPETDEKKNAAKSGASPAEYAHKVSATVTDKLAPVYQKVADAGSSVVSKVKGSTGTGQEGSETSGGKVPDKGVSVKEYLVEKFKPREEDKALSEVISETLHKKKEAVGKTGESKPMGKVTESEEVARRLGTGMERKREGKDAIAAGRESSGKGMVDRLKGAVSSWIVKGREDQQYSQGSADSSNVRNEGSAASDEIGHRRLQESGN
ncbi:low-temperature-induced 65 kDa protein [Coffea arabica]|uniref:Low-temperature-induced 65 kDa protein n=1 Tax=Coffea arabica TaxID=13443 RepID=A0A6P6WV75_COFAR|nr:low-temperature-induced 65 kDa protein-like [Coffea arabica]